MNKDENNPTPEREVLLQTTISALVESEQSYRLLAETASDVIIKIDAENTILFVNQACERIFGYSPTEMTGKPITMVIPELLRETQHFQIKKYLEDGRANRKWETIEVPAIHKSGRMFPLEISFGEFHGATGHFFIGTGRDISKRREAEKEIAHLAAIVESSEDGIISKNLDGIITSWNKGAERIFGHSAVEIIGKPIDLLIPAHLKAEEPEIISRIKKGENIQHYESVRQRKDGSLINISLTISPIKNSEGEIIGASKIVRDITENKKAERALLESRMMLSLAMQSSKMGVWEQDVATEIVHWSEELEEIFGLEKGGFAGTRAAYYELVHEDDRERIFDEVQTAIEEKRAYRMEFRFYHADGSIRWMEGRGQAVYSENGEPIRVYGIGIDITDRKQSEKTLNENQSEIDRQRRLYDTILSNTPDLTYVFDLEHNFTFANSVLLKMWGKTWDEAIGKSFPDLGYEPWHAEMHNREIEQVIATKQPIRGEVPFSGTFGRRIYDYIFVPILGENGEVEAVAGTTRDITEIRQSEINLRESEERFRGLQQATPDGFMIFESVRDANDEIVDFKWLYVNPSAEKIVGRTEAELVGKHLLEVMPGNRDEGLFDDYLNVVKTGDLWQKEFQYLHENLDHYFLSTAVKVSDGFAVAFSDITERKKIEIEREVLLEREKEARLEAEAANRAKDEFLSVLSHELRTPLNSILGWTRMMKSGSLEESRFQQAVDTIERNARLQNNLIEDLLDVSRIISGKMLIEEEEVDFVSVVNSAVETVQTSADAKKISLKFNSETDELKIVGDSTRLQQIIVNLTNNAVKFTPENGSVNLHLSNTDDFLMLKITDTGIGISEEFLPHIFDRFRQADSTTRRNHSGLGLGLTIAGHLTELHGGEISAASDGANKGSVFTLKIPHDFKTSSLSEVKSKLYSEASNVSNEKLLEGKSILLVDDDCDGVMPVQLFLEKQGAQVHCADKAQDALEKLIEQEFDLVVSDIGMPEFDGYHLISKIRESEKTAKIPAIALTAYASSEDRERALFFGFNQHLAKPVDFERLLQTILNSLNQNETE